MQVQSTEDCVVFPITMHLAKAGLGHSMGKTLNSTTGKLYGNEKGGRRTCRMKGM